jgi:hypothetical protein
LHNHPAHPSVRYIANTTVQPRKNLPCTRVSKVVYAQRVILTLALFAEVLSLIQQVFSEKWAKTEQKQNITSQLALEEIL